jgi:hypothetical protein
MHFSKFSSKREQLSTKVVASASSKRRFIVRGSWVAGIVYWLGMNAFFLTRYHKSLEGRFLAGWEIAMLVIGILFGLMSSLVLWSRLKQFSKSK